MVCNDVAIAWGIVTDRVLNAIARAFARKDNQSCGSSDRFTAAATSQDQPGIPVHILC